MKAVEHGIVGWSNFKKDPSAVALIRYILNLFSVSLKKSIPKLQHLQPSILHKWQIFGITVGITARKSPRPLILRNIQPPKHNSRNPWVWRPHFFMNAFLEGNIDVSHNDRNFMVLQKVTVSCSLPKIQVKARIPSQQYQLQPSGPFCSMPSNQSYLLISQVPQMYLLPPPNALPKWTQKHQ
jgi:hypothetical protein